MKKTKITAFLITSLMAISMIGCGSADSDVDANADNIGDSAEQGYVFSYNGVDIEVDKEAGNLKSTVGEPLEYFEAESCAAQGIGKTYTYSDVIIETYPDGDKDMVLYITLKSDMVSTAEGADLSMTKEEVIAIYGEATTQTDSSLTYKKGSMGLIFIFDGDTMNSIQYSSKLNM